MIAVILFFRRDLRVDYLEQDPQYPEELTVLEACFHHGNSTVELIKEYERCMETEGHPGLEKPLGTYGSGESLGV